MAATHPFFHEKAGSSVRGNLNLEEKSQKVVFPIARFPSGG
jgi:hypothetical protein